jgi:hypothetical protein
MSLIGARQGSAEPLSRLDSVSNYFIGKDPARWRTSIPNYARIAYRSVYAGVDVVYYGRDGQLEYDFVVSPGADSSAIVITFDGIESMTLEANGDLLMRTSGNEIRSRRPTIYQHDGVSQQQVEGGYKLLSGNRLGFTIGNYDHKRELVIDPVLNYSTYVGGTSWDEGVGFALDTSGYAYVSGWTMSGDFPITSPNFQRTLAGGANYGDAFVFKMNPTGTALVYSTYIGGTGDDLSWGLAVDSNGNAYITGYTSSSDFPTTAGAFQTSLSNSSSAFVTKLNSTGTALIYSTYLGGDTQERGYAIAIDSAGSAYVTGLTRSSNFPVSSGAYQTSNPGDTSAFVTKLNAGGTGLTYSTYIGGPGSSWASAIALDSSGAAYLAGYTQSPQYPTTPGAFQRNFGSGLGHGFVTKVTPDGTGLAYSTLLASSGEDYARGITVDQSGNAYVGGRAGAADFPVTNGAYQTKFGGVNDAFVTELNSTGSGVVYSTLLGGSGNDQLEGLTVDSTGSVVAVGLTNSSDFPLTPDALQSSRLGTQTGWVTKLNPTGASLLFSTYLGGSGGTDLVIAVALDAASDAYVMGFTNSPDFPTTPGAFQTGFGGGTGNVFVANITFSGCGFTLSRRSQSVDSTGGQISIGVNTDAGCSWTSTSNVPWITVVSGSGMGAGTAQLSVASNADATRTGTVVIAGQFFTVNQSAPLVSITIDPAGRTIVVDSTTYSAPQKFSWPIGSTHSITVR